MTTTMVEIAAVLLAKKELGKIMIGCCCRFHHAKKLGQMDIQKMHVLLQIMENFQPLKNLIYMKITLTLYIV